MAIPAEGFTRGVGFGDSLTKGNTSSVNGDSYPPMVTGLNPLVQCIKRGVPGRTLQDMAGGTVFNDEVRDAGCGPNLVVDSEFYVGVSEWTQANPTSILTKFTNGSNVASLNIFNGIASNARAHNNITGLDTGKSYVYALRRIPDVPTESTKYFVGSDTDGAESFDQLGSVTTSGFNSRSFSPSVTSIFLQLQVDSAVINEETHVSEVELREDLPPEFVFMPGGVNDAVGGRTGAQMIADRDTIIGLADTASIEIIIATIAPFGAASIIQDEVDIYNASTLALAPARTIIDNATLFADPSDINKLNPRYDSGDGLHWNLAGQSLEAKSLLAVIRPSDPPSLDTPYSDVSAVVGDSYGPVDYTSNTSGASVYSLSGFPDGIDTSDPEAVAGTFLAYGKSYPGVDASNELGSAPQNHFVFDISPQELTVSETAIAPVVNTTPIDLKKLDGHNIMGSGLAHNFVGVRVFSDAAGTIEVPITGTAVVNVTTVEGPEDVIPEEGTTGQRWSFSGNPIGSNITFTGGNTGHFFKVFARQNKT